MAETEYLEEFKEIFKKSEESEEMKKEQLKAFIKGYKIQEDSNPRRASSYHPGYAVQQSYESKESNGKIKEAYELGRTLKMTHVLVDDYLNKRIDDEQFKAEIDNIKKNMDTYGYKVSKKYITNRLKSIAKEYQGNLSEEKKDGLLYAATVLAPPTKKITPEPIAKKEYKK